MLDYLLPLLLPALANLHDPLERLAVFLDAFGSLAVLLLEEGDFVLEHLLLLPEGSPLFPFGLQSLANADELRIQVGQLLSVKADRTHTIKLMVVAIFPNQPHSHFQQNLQ